MADISGVFRHNTRPAVTFEANQVGEKWTVVARSAAKRFEAATWQPAPWACIERLVGDALDSAQHESESPRYDMNRKLDKPLTPKPLRRRAKLPPGSVPEWKAPD